MQASSMRYVAVDWSGAESPSVQRRRIVAAEWNGGNVALHTGRTRDEMTDWLIAQARSDARVVVGLDFSFSLPYWFVQQSGVTSIEAIWRFAADHAEQWLRACREPFWGRPGRRCPARHGAPEWRGYRRCEQTVLGGRRPKSTFQIGGAGAVGTGSLRGMATLLALRNAGFSIWPFHPPGFPMALEMYPRSFTGAVNKSSAEARSAWLRTHLAQVDPAIPKEVLRQAAASEDAFDALCAVIGMANQAGELLTLAQSTDSITLLEGEIFPGRPLPSR